MKTIAYILSFCFILMSVSTYAIQVHNHKEIKQESCCKEKITQKCHQSESINNTKSNNNCCENDCLCVLNYVPVSILNKNYSSGLDIKSEKQSFFTNSEATINIVSLLFRPPKTV